MTDGKADIFLRGLTSTEKIKLLELLLEELDAPGRSGIFKKLLADEVIHEFENRVGARAPVILEAMHRASAFTVRGIEGVIAEAAFALEVLPTLTGWRDRKPVGEDRPFDFDLEGPVTKGASISSDDAFTHVRVQVKMQRRESGNPMTAHQAFRRFPEDMWVVETQKSRKGVKGGASTRPYRFGEFDVLAVSMKATQGKWSNYMYTVADWLLPDADPKAILKFQPIPRAPNSDWTDNFLTVVDWLMSGAKKSIAGSIVPSAQKAKRARRRRAKPKDH